MFKLRSHTIRAPNDLETQRLHQFWVLLRDVQYAAEKSNQNGQSKKNKYFVCNFWKSEKADFGEIHGNLWVSWTMIKKYHNEPSNSTCPSKNLKFVFIFNIDFANVSIHRD